ncbi:MAG TPA: hypothetical protein VGP22_09475, partial [Albitalea sp.]|nr:hypothetical protein [Albitalea sp.]
MNMKHFGGTGTLACTVAALAAVVAGCGSGGGSESVTVNGDVPIAYVMRVNTVGANPTNGAPTVPGGDLMIREKSSSSAAEHNITSAYTRNLGDASDPEVSYDGKKIVFAMRCPVTGSPLLPSGQAACTGRWNIWEYDLSAGFTGGSFRRLTGSTTDDDADPAYLPAGRGFVFTSNRQTKSKVQALGQT